MDWTDRIGRRVRLRDLHVFLTVAKSGTMGRAAAALSVSQPVISKSISELEAALRVRLFDRSARGIALTTYGAAMIECGRAVFDDLQKGIRTIEFLADPSGGNLHVGCTEFGAMGLVPLIMERLVPRYPRLQLHVTTADPNSLASVALPQRAVEVAVGAIPAELPADIEAEKLFEDSPVVMAGTRSPWTKRGRLRLADLVDSPWVLPPVGSSRERASTRLSFRRDCPHRLLGSRRSRCPCATSCSRAGNTSRSCREKRRSLRSNCRSSR